MNLTAPPHPPTQGRFARLGRAGRIGAAVTLAGVAALAAAEWAGWPFLRAPLAQQLSRLAAVPVTIAAPFRIKLLGAPTLTAAQFTVAAAAGTPAPFLLDASGVQLSLRWADLWSAARGGGVRVRELRADDLKAHLLRAEDGRASWQVGAKPGSAPATGVPTPVLERLWVRRASVAVDDRPLRLQMDVQVADAPGSGKGCRVQADIDATASTTANAGTRASARADAGNAAAPCVRITALGLYRRAEVSAQFDVDDMLTLFSPHRPAAPMAHVNGQAAVGRAVLKFAGEMGGLAEVTVLQGAFTATGPSLGLVMAPLGVTLPQTPPFILQGQVGLDGRVWQLSADRMDIGSSRLAGRFALDAGRQPVHLSGQLTGKLLAMQDLGPSVGAQAPLPERGRVLPEKVLDIPSLNAMDADVDVAIDSFGFGTAAVAPLSALRVTVSLRDGHLKLEKLSAQVAGGTVRGSSSLQAKGAQAQWQAALQFDGIALSRWVRSLQVAAPPPARKPIASAASPASVAVSASASTAAPAVPVPVPLASGALRARVSLIGQGRSVAEVLGSADGQLQAMLSNGTLSHLVTEAAGLDVAEALGVLIRGDRSLPLRCARVQARVSKGVVGPVQGVLDNSDSTIRLDGQIDLRNEAMDLRLVAKPKDFSPLSLRSPVQVRGSLSQPRLSVAAGPVAARVLGALALGAVAPVLAWVPLFDAGEGKEADACAPTVPVKSEKKKP